MNFETELSNGKFCIPECEKCKKITWPPAEFCSHCFGTISLKQITGDGKIIEFSKQGEHYFCMVEFFEIVRIIAKISKTPKIGQTVKISKCGIKNGDHFFQII